MRTVTAHSENVDPVPAEFADFYRSTVRRTFRIAHLMACGDQRIARTATQHAYERLLSRWRTHDILSAQHKSRRASGFAVRAVADAHVADDEPGEASGEESAAELVALLPPSGRAIAILFCLEEYSTEEIAGVLDVAESEIVAQTDRIRLILKPPVVRRAHDEDRPPPFDVDAGLSDLLDRAAVRPHWRDLAGRERNAACLIAARQGDRAAFTALVRDLTPLVWHVARGNGLGRAEAEDVTQTVWLALLRSLDRLADPRALAAWLITTTRRESHRLRRQEGRAVELGDAGAEHLPAPDPTPEDEALRHDRDRTLWTVFHRLSPRCQEMLRLTVLAGRAEYRSVAEALHMPVGGIGPTRGRCLKTLREYYEREAGR